MENCLFCGIVAGKVPAAKIWEDDSFLAVLDVFPNTPGMTLIISKVHYDSYAFDMADDAYCDFFQAAKKVAKLLETGLEVKRVALVMEGMGINHAHLKLYPLHGLEEKFKETWAKEKIFFDRYPGYISTQLGNQTNSNELQKLADLIRAKNNL